MAEIDELDDRVAAAAFRRLVRHLQHRKDAENIELMGAGGLLPQLPGRVDRGGVGGD